MASKTKTDFLGIFIGNPARAQLMRVFLFNPNEPFTFSAVAKRAGMSAQAVAREMKALEQLGIIKKGKQLTIALGNGSNRTVKGKQKFDTWAVDTDFKHLRALSSFVHEVSPIRYDTIIGALKRSGKIATVILSGSFMGDSTRPADMIVAVDSLNERRIESAVRSLEPAFGREIRYAAFSTPEFRYRLTIQDKLLRDTLDFPHLVLLDRTRLL
ncbi:MAG: hypothetical protein WC050_04290 [Candidatus Paceibacterota bacterium]